MTDQNTCSAWRPGVFCRNGFTITGPCNPGRIKHTAPPQCCDEEWCGKVFSETGKPDDAMTAQEGAQGERQYLMCRCHDDVARRLCADRDRCCRPETQGARGESK